MAFVPIYILILLFTIVIDYAAGIIIEKAAGKRKKVFLIISVVSNIGVLAVFKYYNFLNENLCSLLHIFNYNNSLPFLNILLPIGLSFHTFQALSYTIEVYRGNQKAEKHFGIYALYVMFYPQLVAGPIERPQHILHQFYEKHDFNYYNVTNGLKLMAWGLFKKVVIADRLAIMVNQVYNDPTKHEGIPLIISTVFFSFQIFCDFSGYTDIALGSAQVMGFRLMQNFNRPYFSRSISEFWKRWHISLSSWFKDYLYIPLGGNKVIKWKWYYNLFITFLISGLWHGANWTFLAWGAIHGFYLIFAIIFGPFKKSITERTGIYKYPFIKKLIQVFTTFVLVSFAWIFFRANTISDALYIISHLHTNIFNQLCQISKNDFFQRSELLYLGQDKFTFIIAVLSIAIMEFIHYKQKNRKVPEMISLAPLWLRWSCYYMLIIIIMVFGVFSKSQFIYFQF